MTKFVGRRGQLGLAVESTRGTPVAPTFWVPVATMSFQDRTEEAREEQGLGIIADSDSKYVTQKMGEGEIEAQIYDKAFGAILTGLLGAAPSTGAGPPYTHTYTLTNTNQHKSLSLYWKDPDRSDMFPLGMLNSLQLSVEPSGLVNWTIGFMSKSSRDWSSQTASYTSLGSKWLHQHLKFSVAAAVGSLPGTAISLKSLELNINKNTVFDSVMGTVEPEDILNQQLSVDGSIELNLEDDTYKAYMLDGTYRAMEIKLDGGSNSALTLRFPRVDFSEWESDYTLNEIAKQTINFKANYDAANALDIISTATLLNTQAGGSYG